MKPFTINVKSLVAIGGGARRAVPPSFLLITFWQSLVAYDQDTVIEQSPTLIEQSGLPGLYSYSMSSWSVVLLVTLSPIE